MYWHPQFPEYRHSASYRTVTFWKLRRSRNWQYIWSNYVANSECSHNHCSREIKNSKIIKPRFFQNGFLLQLHTSASDCKGDW